MRQRVAAFPSRRHTPRSHADDLLAALDVFLLVFLSTFPVVIPFLLMHDAMRALRISNAVAIVLLF